MSDTEKKKISDKIDWIETRNIEKPDIDPKYFIKDRSNSSDDSRIIIHFENGGKMQIRVQEDKEIPIEETFKPNDPHSVWESSLLNGFVYKEEWSKEKRIRKAIKWNIQEMESRDIDDPLNDWESLRACFPN